MDRPVILAAGRRARCAVEVAAEPTPTEEMAAEELVRYLGQLGGASFELHRGEKSGAPVRILVGARAREADGLPLDQVRDDGFVLRAAPDRIALAGANDRGTLYAAYELIERLGVRWYWPGPENEYLPPAGDLEVPRGTEVINPSFRFRFLRALFSAMVGLGKVDIFQPFASPRREQLLDWGVKNRLNAAFWPFDDPAVSAFFVRRGGVACLDHAHVLPHLVPPDEYYDSHPDYFAKDDDGRLFERRPNAYHMHLCTSHPEVGDLVVRTIPSGEVPRQPPPDPRARGDLHRGGLRGGHLSSGPRVRCSSAAGPSRLLTGLSRDGLQPLSCPAETKEPGQVPTGSAGLDPGLAFLDGLLAKCWQAQPIALFCASPSTPA